MRDLTPRPLVWASVTIPNIASPEFKADPYPFYARLRAESPVFRVELPTGQPAWLVTRYDDVAAVLKDERFAKDRGNALPPEQAGKQPWVPDLFKPLARNMLDVDPPDHTRLRQLVHKAFTPRLVERLRERVQGLTEELIAAAERRGRMDLIADYALPIPATIIAEMLGVPASDRHRFHRWSRVIVASNPSGWGMVRAIPSAIGFLRYIRKLVKARRSSPRDDLATALVQAEEEGARLDEDELVSMVFLLLIAGHETTVNLIGNGMLALLRHPDQMQAPPRRARHDQGRGRGAAEVRRPPGDGHRTLCPGRRGSRGDRSSVEENWSTPCSHPQTGTSDSSPIRIDWTSLANRTSISPSASESTIASARRSPGSRARLRSARWSADYRIFG